MDITTVTLAFGFTGVIGSIIGSIGWILLQQQYRESWREVVSTMTSSLVEASPLSHEDRTSLADIIETVTSPEVLDSIVIESMSTRDLAMAMVQASGNFFTSAEREYIESEVDRWSRLFDPSDPHHKNQ